MGTPCGFGRGFSLLGGVGSPCRPGVQGGAWQFWLPADSAFSLLCCPPSPKGKDSPPPPALAERSSPAGKGVTQSLFCRGLRPRHPGIRPLAARTDLAKQVPRAEGSPRFASKPIEPPFYWQCRQPRRGGTGGEELRRLRWSSPPGRGEQVPQGEQPPLRSPAWQGL